MMKTPIGHIVLILMFVMSYFGFNTGFVTDGEFSTLRRKGDDKIPTHLYQVIQDIRPEVSKLGVTKMRQILIKTEGRSYS